MAKVLVIDDDPIMAREIVDCLNGSGFQTHLCTTGPEGLHAGLIGSYDAITLDRVLPGFDGLHVAQTLRDSGVDTPILMLSALAQLDDRNSWTAQWWRRLCD